MVVFLFLFVIIIGVVVWNSCVNVFNLVFGRIMLKNLEG